MLPEQNPFIDETFSLSSNDRTFCLSLVILASTLLHHLCFLRSPYVSPFRTICYVLQWEGWKSQLFVYVSSINKHLLYWMAGLILIRIWCHHYIWFIQPNLFFKRSLVCQCNSWWPKQDRTDFILIAYLVSQTDTNPTALPTQSGQRNYSLAVARR